MENRASRMSFSSASPFWKPTFLMFLIVLHALTQNNDLVRIFHGIFFALTDKFGTKP